jgi:hypothetical protein
MNPATGNTTVSKHNDNLSVGNFHQIVVTNLSLYSGAMLHKTACNVQMEQFFFMLESIAHKIVFRIFYQSQLTTQLETLSNLIFTYEFFC